MRRRPLSVLLLVTAMSLAACGGDAQPSPVDAGAGRASPTRGPQAAARPFSAHRVIGGLDFPATFTFAPNGRIFYGERFNGQIHIFDRKTRRDHLFFTLPNVAGDGEQGLLGIALHPLFPRQPFVYVYATRHVAGHLQNQVLRLRAENGSGSGLRVMFRSSTVPGPYHDGGRILFGPDGMLYLVIGESHDSSNAQDLGNSAGKILRMTPRGKPAPGNPFPGKRIFAYGIRNSYGFDFDPRTARLWETENGPECNDELNRIVRGGNFGWGPKETCGGTSPGDTNNSGPRPRHMPERWWTPTIAPTGIAFCNGCGLGPGTRGRIFLGAYNTGQIRKIALGSRRFHVRRVRVVHTHSQGILSMESAPNGELFFSDASGIYRLTRG